MIRGTPGAADFIQGLPVDLADALAQVDGAIMGDNCDPQWSPDDRQAVITERVRLMQAIERRARK